jgi:ankyrin repeat protein
MLPLQLKSAAADGDAGALERLLRSAQPRDRDEDGYTPLHYAAWCGATALCRRLLEGKADVNAANADGKTPLHFAAGYGHWETTALLLDHGAAANAADRGGFTALHQVAEGQWGVTGWEGTGGRPTRHADVVRLLIARGADAARTDTFDRTPLDVASGNEVIRQMLNAALTDRTRGRRTYIGRHPTLTPCLAPNPQASAARGPLSRRAT